MRARKLKLSEDERAFWRSVAAAAYVADFCALRAAAYASNLSQPAFDVALDRASIETAGTIADRAVAELRRWRAEEDKAFGKVVEVEVES